MRGSALGGGFVPEADDPAGLAEYLRARGWLGPDEMVLAVGTAGDGNMNRTLRVVSDRRRLIVKYGPPWVEKYPDIPAPADRTLVEGAFYELVPPPVAALMPACLGVDRRSCVLVLEDVDGATDLTSAYEGTPVGADVVATLLTYLDRLHRAEVRPSDRPFLANVGMRALNHEYIFRRPLSADAALLERLETVTLGLADEARRLAADEAFCARARDLGAEYLHGAPRALVHGDYFPGSWLWDGTRVRIIDPEFCFLGAPEFDYGVMAAHLFLAGQGSGPVHAVAEASSAADGDAGLMTGFAGIEIMRRLLGVAQLPRLHRTLKEKRALLELSRRLVLGQSLL